MQLTNLEKWRYYLKDFESPDIFINWSFYWIISAALQRRVWLGDYKHFPIFPNLYIVFVANPGIGKSMPACIGGARILKTFRFLDHSKLKANLPHDKAWTDVISFSADNTTIQSLIQQLNQSTKTFDLPPRIDPITKLEITERVQHCSLSILLSEEMTSLFKKGNEEVPSFMNHCYDAKDYHYKIKTDGYEDNIKNVCVNFLGCTTPDNMKKMMASGILQGGFTARAIPIYAERPRQRTDELVFDAEQCQKFEEVIKHVERLTKIKGSVKFSDEARAWWKSYYKGNNQYEKSPMDLERTNFDKRTNDYFGRKALHCKKQAMVKHFMEVDFFDIVEKDGKEISLKCNMEISLDTFKSALDDLKVVEMQMHRALASAGMNPLYDITKTIYEAILERGGLTTIQLKLMFAQEVDTFQLDQVIKFLGETGKVKGEMRGTKLAYVATTKEKDVFEETKEMKKPTEQLVITTEGK